MNGILRPSVSCPGTARFHPYFTTGLGVEAVLPGANAHFVQHGLKPKVQKFPYGIGLQIDTDAQWSQLRCFLVNSKRHPDLVERKTQG